ncbi:hypothetical protein EJB05_05773 [Eragrostis curvula]|uniref:Uncharacterized protein n=1 Tax=Eragrostis curvula TaxID=38414 RepID=A0A5J9WDJ1_9POAL|nr:hypothetical protein EJB05_05773 [Eragrostis curvula]
MLVRYRRSICARQGVTHETQCAAQGDATARDATARCERRSDTPRAEDGDAGARGARTAERDAESCDGAEFAWGGACLRVAPAPAAGGREKSGGGQETDCRRGREGAGESGRVGEKHETEEWEEAMNEDSRFSKGEVKQLIHKA